MADIDGDETDNELTGRSGDDTIRGQDGADTIVGAGGADSLYGGSGNDVVEGGDGHDNIFTSGFSQRHDGDRAFGGAGDDTIAGGYRADRLSGEDGDDLILLDLRADELGDYAPLDLRQDTIDGGDGSDAVRLLLNNRSATVDFSVVGEISVNGAVLAVTRSVEGFFYEGSISPQRVAGSAGADIFVMSWAGGDDIVSGGAGDDVIWLGHGSDRAHGGAGDDYVSLVAGGRDKVNLAGGDDALVVEIGLFDTKSAGEFEGGGGRDRLEVQGSGVEFSFDGLTLTANGHVFGAVSGFEQLSMSGSRVVGLAGNDFIEGVAGTAVRLEGRDGDDTLSAEFPTGVDATEADTLDGGAGDDDIEVYVSGDDVLDGGDGTDRLTLLSFLGPARLVMTGSLADGVSLTEGGKAAGTARGFESVDISGSAGDDRLFGGALDDVFNVGFGRDVVHALGGDDHVTLRLDQAADRINLGRGFDAATLLYGVDGEQHVFMRFDGSDLSVSLDGVGATTIESVEQVVVSSGAGNDRLVGVASSDVLSAGTGRNVISGEGGDDALRTLLDGFRDRIDGGDGDDLLEISVDEDGTVPVITTVTAVGDFTLTLGGRTVLTATSIESIVLNGTAFDDLLIGQALADVLNGGRGDDTLIGGSGDDTLSAGGGSDSVSGGDGVDTISFEHAPFLEEIRLRLVSGDAVAAIGDGDKVEIAGVENVIGGHADDWLRGDARDNVIDGGVRGSDTLDGGRGVDTVSFASAGSFSNSGAGVAVVLAGAANTIVTEHGYFTVWRDVIRNFENVIGSEGSDTITGDDGDNRLDGGSNNRPEGDRLTGGGGADVFVFSSQDGRLTEDLAAFDQVRDFSSAEGDRIDLTAMTADPDLPNGGGLAFIGGSAFSGAGGEVRSVAGEFATKLFVDLDGDRDADKTVLFSGRIDFAEADFILA